jgi:hypothetical protein
MRAYNFLVFAELPMTRANLDQFEVYSHSFIIRLWLENGAGESNGGGWRGYIIHVPSGKQCVLKDLNDIVTFIIPYLLPMRMGVMINPKWRIQQWWKRVKQLWRDWN